MNEKNKSSPNVTWRIMMTIIVIGGCLLLQNIFSMTGIESGIAANQLESDTSYIMTRTLQSIPTIMDFTMSITAICLWFHPIKHFIQKNSA